MAIVTPPATGAPLLCRGAPLLLKQWRGLRPGWIGGVWRSRALFAWGCLGLVGWLAGWLVLGVCFFGVSIFGGWALVGVPFCAPEWLTYVRLFWLLVFLIKKTKTPRKVKLFLVRTLRDSALGGICLVGLLHGDSIQVRLVGVLVVFFSFWGRFFGVGWCQVIYWALLGSCQSVYEFDSE